MPLGRPSVRCGKDDPQPDTAKTSGPVVEVLVLVVVVVKVDAVCVSFVVGPGVCVSVPNAHANAKVVLTGGSASRPALPTGGPQLQSATRPEPCLPLDAYCTRDVCPSRARGYGVLPRPAGGHGISSTWRYELAPPSETGALRLATATHAGNACGLRCAAYFETRCNGPQQRYFVSLPRPPSSHYVRARSFRRCAMWAGGIR